MASVIVSSPATYVPDPDVGRPLFNGRIFIGEPNLDPAVEANRKNVTVRQQDGTEVVILPNQQPLATGPGGTFIYNGSSVDIITDGNYSIKALNSQGVQKYFVPNTFGFTPVAAEDVVLKEDTTLTAIDNDSLSLGNYVITMGHTTVGDYGANTYLVVAGGTGTPDNGRYINLTNGLQLQGLFPGGFIVAEQWGANSTTESSARLLAMMNAFNVLNCVGDILTDPFVFNDSSADLSINTGNGGLILQNYNLSNVTYGNYFSQADIKITANSVNCKRLKMRYDTNPATVGGVAMAVTADLINIDDIDFHILKLALMGDEGIRITKLAMINDTNGSSKVSNAQLFTDLTQSNAEHLLSGMHFESWPTDGNNQDIVKVGSIDNNLVTKMHAIFSNNTIVNRNINAAAQVDIYIGGAMANFDTNLFINTQIHRKNDQVAGQELDVIGTTVSDCIFWYQTGFYTATSTPSAAIYMSGGNATIDNVTFKIETFLTQAVIFLEAGVQDTANQTTRMINIKGCQCYADNASEGGNDTEFFIKLGQPQQFYTGTVNVATCQVSGLERFANLFNNNNSVISDCRWINPSPVGTAVSCGSLINFVSTASFIYEARNGINVVNGQRQEIFEEATATVDALFRRSILFNVNTAIVTDITNYHHNEPIIMGSVGPAIEINLPGAASIILLQYESAIFYPYRVNNNTPVRWLALKQ